MMLSDAQAMALALHWAREAARAGEVPVGAVVLKDGVVVGVGRNAPIADTDPCAHAEIRALQAAARHVGNYRLDGCTLFVTLEPCAMCAGALLNARLARVVYGASDRKAGAAGSVVNLFGESRLNHHTRVEGGLLAADARALLQRFFADRREAQRAAPRWPLRDDAVRPPEARFTALPDTGEPSARWVADLPSLGGLRLHYREEAPSDAESAHPLPITWVCWHDWPAWGYEFRHMIPVWRAQGHRVVVPDMPGWGRSDQPKHARQHTARWHAQVMLEWLDRVVPGPFRLVCDGWACGLALGLWPFVKDRVQGLVLLQPPWRHPPPPDEPQTRRHGAGRAPWPGPSQAVGHWLSSQMPLGLTPAVQAAYDAPFPNAGHRAAVLAGQRAEAASAVPPGLDLQRPIAAAVPIWQVVGSASFAAAPIGFTAAHTTVWPDAGRLLPEQIGRELALEALWRLAPNTQQAQQVEHGAAPTACFVHTSEPSG
jgi:tRNA(adenine34) deaminase